MSNLNIVYRYTGPGYVVGIPARDLTEQDLQEIEAREGITRELVEASGLYELAEPPQERKQTSRRKMNDAESIPQDPDQ